MAHLQYIPGDPRLVDQLVYELKSKGIFDQFRKDCIADVDTRPAYQNLRQRVENSVATFLSRQTWQPDMNKNQLREKLRKHILDGNYLEQGVERIVDQVVNPKVATVFIPKVEDLVYKVLGITKKKSPSAETSNEKVEDLLPNDLEAVSPGSVKSNDDKSEAMDVDSTQDNKMDIDDEKSKLDTNENSFILESEKENTGDIQLPSNIQNDDVDKSNIPLPSEEIKPENIPSPDTSPPKLELEKIELPKEPIISTDIPLPNDICKEEKDQYFKPVNSEDDESSSGSSLRRNMSPLTPIRNFNNENSCDAQQAFENDSTDNKSEDKKEPSTFRFKIDGKISENSSDAVKAEKKETETNLSYQFNSQVNINNFNTPLYEDSSNSNNLRIDYESDANSKVNIEIKAPDNDQTSEDSRKEKKTEEKKSSHKSSHRSRESHKHSSSNDKRSDYKHSNSRDSSSKHDKNKSSKDENKSKSSDKDKSKDKNEKKDSSSRESSRHRSSHKSSHRDSKSHRSTSSSGHHSSKNSDEKKSSSSSSSHKDKSSDKSSSEKSKDSKSSSHKSSKDRKSSSSSRSDKSNSKSKNDKDKDKKGKKENDDHYSLSGRGNPNRRSTDRDSNDGSSSSKGSHNPSSSKSSSSKKDSKSSSKSESTSTSGESTSPSDKENIIHEHTSKTREALQQKPIVRIEKHLEVALKSPPRLPFVPDVTIKKPKFAANLEEAKRLMKMRKFLDEEQKRMNQEAALLLEFQANVRPSMSQVYSSIPGPELEFACVSNVGNSQEMVVQSNDNISILNEERENINTATVEHDNVSTIEESNYTNNELVTVLNEANSEGYEMQSDNNINQTSIKINDSAQGCVVIEESNGQINLKSETVSENHVQENDNVSTIYVIEESQDTKCDDVEKESINENIDIIEQIDNEGMAIKNDEILNETIERPQNRDTKHYTNLFEITVIAEALSENENSTDDFIRDVKCDVTDDVTDTPEVVNCDTNDTLTDNEKIDETPHEAEEDAKINGEDKLRYFGEHEKYNAEIERAQFNNFFKEYTTKIAQTNKLYLINCDSYEENVIREVSKDLGNFEIVTYHKNGHLKLPINKNVIKNVNISTEISLPMDTEYSDNYYDEQSNQMFSPDKSECSFELSEYDTKLEEMVNKTSRQEIMEIILGNVIDTSANKMPQIDYCSESNIDSDYENSLKRKICEINEISEETASVNNNRPVLTPNKIRKLSTDQITSTTQENEDTPHNKTQNVTRSKYLGKARRVGLPRPKRTMLPNSPSSDKSVENYEQNSPTPTPNGRLKRTKVQRYDTSDLYKPKLHYLSRRNHIT
ncbi:biorientation of chromosomes in cell division protein 1-like 1 [Bicyclus anynana]|uniref:Biorientation of chromosomes in cell division protein 1-like 1 n=1 Tax=Bicyclus anynana TaxID=110368 RepID=A0A6J1NH41_BICAN|nr:biorientation of chromosomes in cell division protein 1-like 1 [Bicyclus anynana]